MTNQPNVENFLAQSFKLGTDYEKVQQLMQFIYDEMQAKKTIDSKQLLETLNELSKSMLNTQRDFVEVYADDSIKAQMHYKIDMKEQALSLNESEWKGKTH